MTLEKSAVLRARSAFGVLIAGLIVTLLWPIVTATFVLNAWDPFETCARVHSSGQRIRYDFFPPRMLCSTGPDAWASATAEGVTIGLSIVLVLGIAGMMVGVIAGVWSVPRVAPAASGMNFADVAGTLPSLRVRRLRRLCGLLAVISILSPAWMLYLGLGVDQGGSGAADSYTQIPIYVGQLLVAAAIPVLALAAGIGGWVLRARARSGGADAASVAVAGLIAAVVLLGLTLSLGVGAIAKVVSAGERSEPSATDSAQISVPPSSGGVELVRPAEAPPIVRPTEPSTALSAAELEQQFAALVTQTTARFGPAFEEPERQGAIPGAALDLAVAAAPYAFDCLGTGIGYGMELTFSGADTDDWDVNYDAAADAYLRITTGWATDGHPSTPENSEFYAYADEPSVVSQLRARHVGSTVRVGMQSLCVAK